MEEEYQHNEDFDYYDRRLRRYPQGRSSRPSLTDLLNVFENVVLCHYVRVADLLYYKFIKARTVELTTY